VGGGVIAAHTRGHHASAAGRLDRAKELFADKIPPIWFWARALAAAAAGDFAVAEQAGEQAVEAHPQNAVLRNNLAVLKELAGDLPGAEDLARGALHDEPSLPQLSKNLGDLAYRGSRYDEAWDLYQRAVELSPALGDDVYFKLGNIAYKRSDRDHAAELWRRALELNPKHELVRANLETLSTLS
jgi:tetratricopeptide (TPR) repeat protein